MAASIAPAATARPTRPRCPPTWTDAWDEGACKGDVPRQGAYVRGGAVGKGRKSITYPVDPVRI
ncbi:hypothetical protein GHA01_19240 [Novacetimonas hansenii]|uniref:Uncharacterized protein n=2 Tax=Novacetimonas hansenii TaxID=436 RepID=A0ABQ0SFH5_NOVHA|nr:hypothetical protein GXY_13703 [Novacetimonas hansenii ATCC 23769]GAN84103.1 hypothetical protein Gaha_0129_005 [Novacetimonas hansenii JCM 7643]GBQ54462.1 hypothetical protein AA0243_0631 [Novacetimonas hansenii NRIC 0243]GEC64075.1 hypothetical protein GHA01_19240 [Novacetimonas hansenii]